MMDNKTYGRHTVGIFLAAIMVAAIAFGGVAPLSAGGTREGESAVQSTPQRATGPLSGEVVDVTTLADGTLELTVRQPDDATVYVEIPAPLARSLRILEGDLIRTTEHNMARDGERLRVQTVTIDRNR